MQKNAILVATVIRELSVTVLFVAAGLTLNMEKDPDGRLCVAAWCNHSGPDRMCVRACVCVGM